MERRLIPGRGGKRCWASEQPAALLARPKAQEPEQNEQWRSADESGEHRLQSGGGAVAQAPRAGTFSLAEVHGRLLRAAAPRQANLRQPRPLPFFASVFPFA